MADDRLPLLERVKFLILFSERIDEFFQVQVAGLKRQVVAGIKTRASNGRTPDELLGDVRQSLRRMIQRQETLLVETVAPALAAHQIELCDWDDLGSAEREHVHELFDQLILPVVTPLTVDPSHPFPYISNLSLNVGVEVRDPSDDSFRFARVKVPPNVPRLLPLSEGTGSRRWSRCWWRSSGSCSRAWSWDRRASSGSPVTPTWPSTRTPPTTCSSPSKRSSAAAGSYRSSGWRSTRRSRRNRWTGSPPTWGWSRRTSSTYQGPLGLDCLWAIHALDRPELHDEPWTPLVPPVLVPVERDTLPES